MNFLGFGQGGGGVIPTSGTFGAGVLCSGTAASDILTVPSSAAFNIGDRITIIQMTGSSGVVGKIEESYVIAKPTGTTLQLIKSLTNTYTNSGDTKAVCFVTAEYSGGDISSTWQSATWDKNTDLGGLIHIVSKGTIIISGSLTAAARGFEHGESSQTGGEEHGHRGFGYTGVDNGRETSSIDSGGGGGGRQYDNPGGGGGGGNVSGGTNGGPGAGGSGQGGQSAPVDSLGDRVIMGGAGGNGGTRHTPTQGGQGGRGGGIVIVTAPKIIVTGTMSANGANGGNGANAGGGAGGGAGGYILLRAIEAVLGTNKVSAGGGSGGSGAGTNNNGGPASVGKIVVNACKVTGSISTGSVTLNQGGQIYCASNSTIIE